MQQMFGLGCSIWAVKDSADPDEIMIEMQYFMQSDLKLVLFQKKQMSHHRTPSFEPFSSYVTLIIRQSHQYPTKSSPWPM